MRRLRPAPLVTLVLVAWLAAVAACGKPAPASGKLVRIAAASDLAKAFEEIGKAFEARTGIHPEFNFGSSGMLAKQIAQGAPYTLFAAANKAFVTEVVKAGRCDGATARLYGQGRIVVWTAKGKPAPASLADLAQPAYAKIAIANPDHAPYGVAAREALTAAGVWPQIEGRLVLGENVLATMLYAREGNADAAIVALSLALVTEGGTSLAIDPAQHAPLDQQLVVCGTGPEAEAARAFADFVASAEGRATMTRYGFVLPGETAGAAPVAKPAEARP